MNIEKIENSINYQIDYYDILSSTHIKAKQIAKKISDNRIIIAEVQNNAIGSKGKSWYTGNRKNIAMTIILKKDFKLNNLTNLTVRIAQSIKRAIKNLYNYNLEIKKPNDLMLNGKKICGILTQISTKGENINYLLISIGFNVNEENFLEEIKKIATSLKLEYRKNFGREEIIIEIIKELKKEIEF